MRQLKRVPSSRTISAKKRFLKQYLKYCMVGKAAQAAGISRSQVYRWLKKDKVFAALFEDARQEALEQLEREAWRRATKGVSKPVFYKGEQCGIIQEYSDTLLIVLLKALAPEKYREHIEHTSSKGGSIVVKEVEVKVIDGGK